MSMNILINLKKRKLIVHVYMYNQWYVAELLQTKFLIILECKVPYTQNIVADGT